MNYRRASFLVLTSRFACLVGSFRAELAFPTSIRSLSSASTHIEMTGRGDYYKNKYGGGGGRGNGGGRGDYYKNKYGRGRGGRGRGDSSSDERRPTGGGSYEQLRATLQQIDSKQYGAYHALDTPLNGKGWNNLIEGYSLYVSRAQSDAFAPPTRCRVVVDADKAALPRDLYDTPVRSVALSDYLLRRLYECCKYSGADAALAGKGGWSGPKGGDIQIMEPCQHVLEQSAVQVKETGQVVAQLTINLPARGRTILGQAAEDILCRTLPDLIRQSLLFSSLDSEDVREHVDSVDDQVWLQRQLDAKNLVSFVRDGAVLPRRSGVDDRPMDASSAVAFQSPERLRLSFTLPRSGRVVSGMGIPKGVSLIVGGGFHGKSTLLATLQNGIYPKIPGDGREFCVSCPSGVKIRSEDGRWVQSVDISPFINNLPFGKDTTCFSTEDASGSTSQAANIVEAIEMGSRLLLVDEDTCATNFMIRDEKMTQLVSSDKEPITPFLHVIRSLYDDFGVSTLMVVGGVGDYFDKADTVVMMDCYNCADVTERAKRIVAASKPADEDATTRITSYKQTKPRYPNTRLFGSEGKVKVASKSSVQYGETELQLGAVEQIVSKPQANAVACALQVIGNIVPGRAGLQTMREVMQTLSQQVDRQGLDVLAPNQCNGSLARPRGLELAFAINRLRRPDSISQEKR